MNKGRDIYNIEDNKRISFINSLNETNLRERLIRITNLICNDEYRDFVRDCGTDDLADAVASIIVTGDSTFLHD